MDSVTNPPDNAPEEPARHETEDSLQAALARIRRTREFPTISKYVIEINQKLQDTSVHASASELANIILKDYALTNKLLKLVNSAFYGLVAGKVTTVSRAVVLLGHDNVRMAAVSLVLFEHFKSRTAVSDLKDEAIRSFWCGLLAREIAKAQGGMDPEEAFICGLLHQLGKLLVIYHMDREYRDIKFRVNRKGEEEGRAVKRILGVTYHALAVEVARQWNFPQSIYATMAPLSQDQLQDRDRRLEPLWVTVVFTEALAQMISTTRPARHKAAIASLLDHYGRYISVPPEQLRQLMGGCLDKLYDHADALQFDIEKSIFLAQFRGQADDDQKTDGPGAADPPPTGADPVYQLMSDEDLKAPAMEAADQDAVGILVGGVQEMSNAMLGQFDLNDIALTSLEVFYRALQCHRAILFINKRSDQRMEARFGYGKEIQSIIGRLEFDPGSSRDLFGQAISSGKDLIVEDAHAPELCDLVPQWYRDGIDARAFIFLPVVYRQVCVGAFYADMDYAGAMINALEHRYLAMLRNQLILAIKMGR